MQRCQPLVDSMAFHWLSFSHSMLSLFVVNCRYIGYSSKCRKCWKVVTGCHARYHDLTVLRDQLKPPCAAAIRRACWWLTPPKSPRRKKKRLSIGSFFFSFDALIVCCQLSLHRLLFRWKFSDASPKVAQSTEQAFWDLISCDQFSVNFLDELPKVVRVDEQPKVAQTRVKLVVACDFGPGHCLARFN